MIRILYQSKTLPTTYQNTRAAMLRAGKKPLRNIASHSMENLAFHSLLRWKIYYTNNSRWLRLGECTFSAWLIPSPRLSRSRPGRALAAPTSHRSPSLPWRQSHGPASWKRTGKNGRRAGCIQSPWVGCPERRENKTWKHRLRRGTLVINCVSMKVMDAVKEILAGVLSVSPSSERMTRG